MAETKLHNYSVQEKLNKMDMDLITVVPTLQLTAYTAQDSLFDLTKIPDAVSVNGGCALLQSVTMLDFGELADDWTADIYFFSGNTDSDWPAAGTIVTGIDDKAKAQNLFYTPNKFLGRLQLSQTLYDFPESTDDMVRIRQVVNTGLILKANSDSKDVYMAGHLKSSDPTYAAQGDLVFHIGVIKD